MFYKHDYSVHSEPRSDPMMFNSFKKDYKNLRIINLYSDLKADESSLTMNNKKNAYTLLKIKNRKSRNTSQKRNNIYIYILTNMRLSSNKNKIKILIFYSKNK